MTYSKLLICSLPPTYINSNKYVFTRLVTERVPLQDLAKCCLTLRSLGKSPYWPLPCKSYWEYWHISWPTRSYFKIYEKERLSNLSIFSSLENKFVIHMVPLPHFKGFTQNVEKCLNIFWPKHDQKSFVKIMQNRLNAMEKAKTIEN